MEKRKTENKKLPERISALRQMISGKGVSDSIEERYFAEHSKETDKFLCGEVLIILVLLMISFSVEVFSDNVYIVRGDTVTKVFSGISIISLIVTLLIGMSGRNRYRPWFRYLASFTVAVANLVLSAYMTYSIIPILLLPIFLSAFYYDTPYVIATTLLNLIARAIGLFIYYKNYLTIDYYYLGDAVYKVNAKNTVDVIDFILLLVSGVFCVLLSGTLRKAMEEKLRKEKEKAVMDRDMSTAGIIQDRMLVKQFPLRDEYEVAADMTPARMVGGDFYDFIELDNDRVALVIADVSGKGLQASLYMSQIKAIVKVYAQSGNSVDKIAEKANSYLTAGAAKGRYFVTVWVGILDLRTGMLSYTNAGHNPPCISTVGSPYGFLNSRVDFVIGGKPLIKYTEKQIRLYPGDRIFLYTDGVTEAKNEDGKFYGDQRLLACLNEQTDAAPAETVAALKNALHEYSGNAEQYDDITMLSFLFREYAAEKVKAGRSFPADAEHFNEAVRYIRCECEKIVSRENILKDIEIACSEVIANICSYAYEGKAGEFEILTEECGQDIKISFTDHGRPFNPLLNATPDTTVSITDRKAGGFGIFIVKKLMNDVLYRYENDCNVLVLIKQFK
ncbi:MAG: SpoIIE family protein phosphatase [Eubacteriales bacterium]|nr:SpoIIE family protein phosphatase [Eubacteriales bacterium]